MLPFDRKAIKSIAVLGPLAASGPDTLGSWVFEANKPSAISLLDGLKAKAGSKIRIDYAESVRIPPRLHQSPLPGLPGGVTRKQPPIDEVAELARAVELARNADVAVLVLGEAQEMSGEAASRASFDLPGRQQQLLDAVVATGKPVVVLLMSVRPINLHETKASAIMNIWYPGSEGGAAVANLLFGDAVPGGKLPMGWMRDAAHAPMTYMNQISHDPRNAFKRYWDTSSEPTWPFGYGLSYTTFSYANLRVERSTYTPGEIVNVQVDLTNNGKMAGDEVAQLYIHQRSGTSSRPVRELKGFQRATLKPGETRTLRFALNPEDLRYWSDVTRDWVQDDAIFDLWVGGSSKADLGAQFKVARS